MIKWSKLSFSIYCDIKNNGYFRFVYYTDTGVLDILYDENMTSKGVLRDRDKFVLNAGLKSKDLNRFVLFYVANYGELYENS